MLERKILILVLSAFFSLGCLPSTTAPPVLAHPAQKIMGFYGEKEFEYFDLVMPYIVGILALNELEHKRHHQEVKEFIEWYFSKLNYPDKLGMTGTIYDYEVDSAGNETPTYDYDSVDGYSGLFLHLLYRYVVETGDVDILQRYWGKIEDIAYTIPYLQDKDGLTIVFPKSNEKYLMDNCETYGGLTAYLQLRKLAGKNASENDKAIVEFYENSRQRIKKGIFNVYDSNNIRHMRNIDREKDGKMMLDHDYQVPSVWRIFYPDAYAQVLVLYYDILEDMPQARDRVWQILNKRYTAKIRKYPVEQRVMYELTRNKMQKIQYKKG